MGIVQSVIDNDVYYFAIQQAILEEYPLAYATYALNNRGKAKQSFNNPAFVKALKEEIDNIAGLSLKTEEYIWLKNNCPWMKPWYLEYLKNYRFDPRQVTITEDLDVPGGLMISGPWHSAILWQNLLQVISELYFQIVEQGWTHLGQKEKAEDKVFQLADYSMNFIEFGTRRRRDIYTQITFLEVAKKSKFFLGTSNLYLAMKMGLDHKGTVAHEWTMGISALEGLRHANRFAMQKWVDVYEGDLGIALPDTFGTDAFLKDFDMVFSRIFDGTRQDSGDPKEYTEKFIGHYQRMRIDPSTKKILYSDSLNVPKATDIHKYVAKRVIPIYCMGNHFTNDFYNSPALNAVIKLASINGIPVVKLGDDRGKEQGYEAAIRDAKWTFLI